MPVSNMENQNSKNYLNKTLTQILKNLENVTPTTVQLNVNGNQPIKINVTETMRERRDLWENANMDRNTDRADWFWFIYNLSLKLKSWLLVILFIITNKNSDS